MEKDIYVVVAEFEVRKDNSDHMESRPIVFETYRYCNKRKCTAIHRTSEWKLWGLQNR